MKKHYRTENDCLNCGFILQGKFCYNCGQENLQMKESFGHMMNHAISDYFHFDDQFFHTMRPLFLKPGYLTNQYMSGHRVAYLHPVKMYIFISLVYFVLMFQTNNQFTNSNNNSKVTQKELQKAIDSVSKDPDIPAYIKSSVIAKMKSSSSTANKSHEIKLTVANEPVSTTDTSYSEYLASQQKLSKDKRNGYFVNLYFKKAFSYQTEYGDRTKDVILEQFEHNIPKMMFLLLPLCALILMVAFRDKNKYYVEYLIYSLHLHCFVFLFLTLIILLNLAVPVAPINSWIGFLSTIAIIWYIYQSLKVVFGRSPFRTITKLVGASLMYLVAFTVCIVVVFFISALSV